MPLAASNPEPPHPQGGKACVDKARACALLQGFVKSPSRVSQSNLATRLISAGVVSPLLLTLLFLGPAWGWACLVLVAGCIAAWEVYSMSHPDDVPGRVIGVIQCAVLGIALYLFHRDLRAVLTIGALTVTASVLLPLTRVGNIHSAGIRWFASVATPFYVGQLLALALLRSELHEDGPGFVLMTLMFGWMADTGGYFAGRFLGRHPLFPAVSPKKTWEGFFGAIAGAVLGANLAHFWYLPSIPLGHAIVLAVVAGTLGQLGDLAESLIKRATEIKDSGTLIPGHGGMLDRIDALLVASPIVYLYALWTRLG
jgi:phosphatidate cytidylyltransferase